MVATGLTGPFTPIPAKKITELFLSTLIAAPLKTARLAHLTEKGKDTVQVSNRTRVGGEGDPIRVECGAPAATFCPRGLKPLPRNPGGYASIKRKIGSTIAAIFKKFLAP
jgi:hypothetical protein